MFWNYRKLLHLLSLDLVQIKLILGLWPLKTIGAEIKCHPVYLCWPIPGPSIIHEPQYGRRFAPQWQWARLLRVQYCNVFGFIICFRPAYSRTEQIYTFVEDPQTYLTPILSLLFCRKLVLAVFPWMDIEPNQMGGTSWDFAEIKLAPNYSASCDSADCL